MSNVRADAKLVVFVGLLWVGYLVSFIFYGFPLWTLTLNVIFLTGLTLKGYGGVSALMLSLVTTGAIFTHFLFGLPADWIFALIGCVGIILIGMHLATPRGGGEVSANTSGDQNPIPIFLMAIGLRVWLFIFGSSSSNWTNAEPNIITTIVTALFGIVPAFPVWVNALLFVMVNGSLLLWGFLLVKRTLNPVAN